MFSDVSNWLGMVTNAVHIRPEECRFIFDSCKLTKSIGDRSKWLCECIDIKPIYGGSNFPFCFIHPSQPPPPPSSHYPSLFVHGVRTKTMRIELRKYITLFVIPASMTCDSFILDWKCRAGPDRISIKEQNDEPRHNEYVAYQMESCLTTCYVALRSKIMRKCQTRF